VASSLSPTTSVTMCSRDLHLLIFDAIDSVVGGGGNHLPKETSFLVRTLLDLGSHLEG